ncbi:MAG: exo-alpha-sialidase, partial [Chitinophagia bacterium]|nr:exo-alpha-sialidase [Chitinophagia bacterium]
MIKKIIPFAACLFIFGVGYILTFSACDILKIREKEHEEAEASEAGERELLEYEWQRLHDPATGKIPGHIRNLELAFAAQLPNDAKNALLMGKTTASSLSWAARGPWNVGGRTRALAIDASNQNILIAGSCSGGMWRSTDGGSTWRNTSPDTLTPLSVSCLTQDTRRGHTATWYYGTGEAYGASAGASGAYYLGNGIYKSTDSGKTWTVLASTTSTNLVGFDTWGDLIWNIVTNPADTVNDVVIVAAYGGIYRSTNGGTSWTLIRGSLSGATSYFTDVAVSPTGIVYATLSSDGSQRGIFRSVDGGATFTNITPTGFPTTYNR